MKRKIIIALFILFVGISNVFSLNYGGCSYSEVSRLKSLVNNINISYDYREINNKIYFDVTINNITPDMYFYDYFNNKTYYYSDTNSGEITIYGYTDYYGYQNKYKFYSALNNCYGISIGSKYYNIPTYNRFYSDPICSDIPNFNLCQKFIQNNYSYDEFIKLANEYKANKDKTEEEENVIEYKEDIFDKFVDLYVNYYYYFFIGIILICSIVIFLKRDKNKFKL